MAERSIIFSASMVRAILAGQKSLTRRVIRSPGRARAALAKLPAGCRIGLSGPDLELRTRDGADAACVRCPFGAPGGRLWVRETWDFRPWTEESQERSVCLVYAADGAQRYDVAPTDWNPTLYNAERWRPSIFMPRWASRITLDVTRVRVERLHAITTADVLAEGVRRPVDGAGTPLVRLTGKHPPIDYLRAGGMRGPDSWTDDELLRAEFASLWDGINATRAAWASNPWVWCVEFTRVDDAAALPRKAG